MPRSKGTASSTNQGEGKAALRARKATAVKGSEATTRQRATDIRYTPYRDATDILADPDCQHVVDVLGKVIGTNVSPHGYTVMQVAVPVAYATAAVQMQLASTGIHALIRMYTIPPPKFDDDEEMN